MRYKKSVLLAAAVTCGLVAGVYFAFSVSINPGLATLSDAGFTKAFQAIDKAIENPVFFLAFFGAAGLLPYAAYLYRDKATVRVRNLLAAAAILYVVGSFGVTLGGNVPLNNKLAKVPVETSSAAELSKARSEFLKPWSVWHNIRTVANIAALGLIVAACLRPEVQTESRDNKKG